MKTTVENQPGTGWMDRLKASNIAQAWLVLLLVIGFGSALAGVQLSLGPTIEANKANETLEQVPALVFGEELAQKMAAQEQVPDIEPRMVAVPKAGRQVSYPVFEVRYQGDLRGWVVKASGQGYADKIELLLGLSPQLDTITGLFVLDQKETPGLGNKVITPEWRGQFTAKNTRPALAVVKTGAKAANEIDAVTGATISSRSVTAIINTIISDLQPMLAGKQSSAATKGGNNG